MIRAPERGIERYRQTYRQTGRNAQTNKRALKNHHPQLLYLSFPSQTPPAARLPPRPNQTRRDAIPKRLAKGSYLRAPLLDIFLHYRPAISKTPRRGTETQRDLGIPAMHQSRKEKRNSFCSSHLTGRRCSRPGTSNRGGEIEGLAGSPAWTKCATHPEQFLILTV